MAAMGVRSEMDMRGNELCRALADAGCAGDAVRGAARLLEAGRADELVLHLRRCRCELVDAMHESQRRVDRMDCLIRQIEKEMTGRPGRQRK